MKVRLRKRYNFCPRGIFPTNRMRIKNVAVIISLQVLMCCVVHFRTLKRSIHVFNLCVKFRNGLRKLRITKLVADHRGLNWIMSPNLDYVEDYGLVIIYQQCTQTRGHEVVACNHVLLSTDGFSIDISPGRVEGYLTTASTWWIIWPSLNWRFKRITPERQIHTPTKFKGHAKIVGKGSTLPRWVVNGETEMLISHIKHFDKFRMPSTSP